MSKSSKKVKRFRPNLDEPKFLYSSVCHSAPAKKPALRACGNIGTHLGAIPDTDDQTEGLGGWRCSWCGKACKVSRQKNNKTKATVSEDTNA
jgi:hypothetical protein